MESLTQLTVDEFLDRVSARAPTPGGGSVTALVGAVATALSRMVVAYSQTRDDPTDKGQTLTSAAERLARAHQLFRGQITRDADAYARLRSAQKTLKTAEESSEAKKQAEQEWADAVVAAIAVPLEAAATAAESLAILEDTQHIVNRRLLSDWRISAGLLESVAESARCTVLDNARAVMEPMFREKLLADLTSIVRHAQASRAAVDRQAEMPMNEG